MNEAVIAELEEFKASVVAFSSSIDSAQRSELRTYINQHKVAVRRIVVENRCYGTFTIAPPPMIGGLIMKNLDPFNLIFEAPYRMNVTSNIVDMLDATIGALKTSYNAEDKVPTAKDGTLQIESVPGYAFVSMPINPSKPELEDVLDAIKAACAKLNIQAERVDETESNERITDQILASIQKAAFVIIDISDPRPNVYYEAGYAHGFGKKPIFLAKNGSKLEFNLKDYPVIYFGNFADLKRKLTARLQQQVVN